MAPIPVDPAKVHEFADADSFYAWLAKHHDRETEVWIKIHKVGSGLKSITPNEAIDAVLCWGWIDAVRKGLDDRASCSATRRAASSSIWSKINVDNVARLIDEGRMTAARAEARSRRPRPMGGGTAPTAAARI